MNGTPGFPLLHKMSCTNIEGMKHVYTIVEMASGTALVDINPISLSLDDMKNILMVLLHLMFVAKQKLGKAFMHNDLHPGNVLIDLKKDFPSNVLTINKDVHLTGNWPMVTVIDFDMTVSDKFPMNVRHNIPRMSNILFKWLNMIQPEVAVSTKDFLIKWIQDSDTGSTLSLVDRMIKNSRVNYDMANWNFYFAVFLMVRDIKEKRETIPDIGA